MWRCLFAHQVERTRHFVPATKYHTSTKSIGSATLAKIHHFFFSIEVHVRFGGSGTGHRNRRTAGCICSAYIAEIPDKKISHFDGRTAAFLGSHSEHRVCFQEQNKTFINTKEDTRSLSVSTTPKPRGTTDKLHINTRGHQQRSHRHPKQRSSFATSFSATSGHVPDITNPQRRDNENHQWQ